MPMPTGYIIPLSEETEVCPMENNCCDYDPLISWLRNEADESSAAPTGILELADFEDVVSLVQSEKETGFFKIISNPFHTINVFR